MPSILVDPIGWLMHGSGSGKKKGRRKAATANPVRSYQRWAAGFEKRHAASLKERNDLRATRAKARLDRDREIARSKATRAATREARIKAAEARAKQTAARPTVVHAQVTNVPPREPRKAAQPQPRPARPAAMKPAPGPATAKPLTALCGAPTDDGTPCQNPTTGGPCAAGHTPNAKPSVRVTRTRTIRRPGETEEQFLRRGRSKAVAAGLDQRQPGIRARIRKRA